MTTGRRPGRPSKPVEVHRANGNPSKRSDLPPVPIDPTHLVSPEPPSTPVDLGAVGAAAWEELWRAGRRWLVDDADWRLMHMLCSGFDELDRISHYLADTSSWVLYSEKGTPSKNPMWSVKAQLRSQLTAWMCVLGFTPSDAARLGLRTVRVANDLDKLRQRRAERAARTAGGTG